MSPSSDVASSQHPASSSQQQAGSPSRDSAAEKTQPTYIPSRRRVSNNNKFFKGTRFFKVRDVLAVGRCASVSIPRVRPVDDMDDRRRVSLTPWALSPGPFEPMVRALLSQEAAVL